MDYKRVTWLDVAKCIGMICIFLGHFGKEAGLFYEYVFKFHVPLFFFLSGCSCTYEKDLTFIEFLKKKALRLLLPFYTFAILALITNCIWTGTANLKINLLTIALGCIRNCFCAESLWFLTCLFVIEIAFKAIRHIKWMAVRIIILVAVIITKPFYFKEPSMIFNIDSIYYIFFFAMGFYLYPAINSLFDNVKHRLLKLLIFLGTGAYAIIEFLNFNPLDKVNIITKWANVIYTTVLNTTNAMALIMFTIIVSKMLSNIRIMQKIGSDTLYLCGSEYILKQFIFGIAGLFGFDKTAGAPFTTYIYVLALIFIGTWGTSPLLRRLIKSLQKVTVKLFSRYYQHRKQHAAETA